MKKILSIDGGGIRGIIPGQVLVALEQKLQQRSGNAQARLADFFDFVAGTSTGGILTCLYLSPAAEDPTKARFSAQQAVDLYVENGSAIFDVSLWQKVRSGNGLTDEKYDDAALRRVLDRHFGSLKLSQLLRPCLIPAYDITARQEFFFTQHDARRHGPAYDFLLKDVCRATAAAPTYFEAALTPALDGKAYPLIDGGVFANNPALCAYAEVRNAASNPTTEDMLLVSLGTGQVDKPYPYHKAKDWGKVEWPKPLIDILMSGGAAVTDYQTKRIFSAAGKGSQYFRLQTTDLGAASPDLDNASPANLRALVQLGRAAATTHDADLNRIVDLLLTADSDPLRFT
ncbi:patatin-like phospholipase family protein [Hymenobacter profundi]|uniref:Patatin-like phospholipase family protein n=1 Tax=Hymenobacter profundi TaxID=1982110 RepID=A0ABS6WYW2_9BACT|nr:patatin-like phospholipase family protein [Hymenobacter profundi]MBW3128751.1 patatin-like phospholipase family protein [Hymenobacter profundi]